VSHGVDSSWSSRALPPPCKLALSSSSPLLIRSSSLFSFLPPSTTLRGYQRKTLATTGQELGTVYTAVVSFASRTAHHRQPSSKVRARETAEMIKILIAIRAKIKRAIFLKTNIAYEVRSFFLSVRFISLYYHLSSRFAEGGRPSGIRRFSSFSCSYFTSFSAVPSSSVSTGRLRICYHT
jgi:hypothetical protein